MFDIGNHYGGLEVKEEDGKYLWGIENWDGTDFKEIPKYLYDALIKYSISCDLIITKLNRNDKRKPKKPSKQQDS